VILGSFLAAPILLARANEAPVLSGSYTVQNQSESGGQVRVLLQIRLVNRGTRDLPIQRMTLWDFSHPAKGATQRCSIIVRGGGSANIRQSFTISRAELELWKRGSRPRMVLEIGSANGHPATAAVRLDRSSGEKARR
jgi:hypothetical protein